MIIKGVTGGDKGEWILSYLAANEGFTNVEFYDDQDENIVSVLRASKKVPNATFSLFKVHHGKIKPVQ